MLRTLTIVGLAALALALGLALAGPHEAAAANMSPAQFDKMLSGRIAQPAHCKAYWHCYKRCRRCTRVCHRCPK